jgi:hypothetical protein
LDLGQRRARAKRQGSTHKARADDHASISSKADMGGGRWKLANAIANAGLAIDRSARGGEFGILQPSLLDLN